MKALGVILAVLGSLLLAGGIRIAYTRYNLSATHDLGKFVGGMIGSALLLLGGVVLLRKKR